MAGGVQHAAAAPGARSGDPGDALPPEPAAVCGEDRAVRLWPRGDRAPRRRGRLAELSQSPGQARPSLCLPPYRTASNRPGWLLRRPVLRSSGRRPGSARGGAVSGSPRRSPRWVHRDLPRSAPPDSWRSLRCARVPPVDYRDELRPCQSVHYVPDRLFTISPVATPLKGGEGLVSAGIILVERDTSRAIEFSSPDSL